MIKKQKYIHDFITGICVPQIEMNLTSVIVRTRPLNIHWTPELAQDLTAYHHIDAEQELREIVNNLNNLTETTNFEVPDPIQPRTGGLLTLGEVGNIGMRDKQAIIERTINQWSGLGFLEGLDGHVRENIETLFEVQASALINETDTQPDNGFDTINFPIVRNIQPTLLNVEPPQGIIYSLTPNLAEEAEDYEVNWRTSDTWVYENLYGSKVGVRMELKPHEFIKKYKSCFDI